MSENSHFERLRGDRLLDAVDRAWISLENAARDYERLLEQAVCEGLIQPQEAVVD